MKKIEKVKLELKFGKGWGDDVDRYCSVYGIGALSFIIGAHTIPAAAFCAGWSYGRAWM